MIAVEDISDTDDEITVSRMRASQVAAISKVYHVETEEEAVARAKRQSITLHHIFTPEEKAKKLVAIQNLSGIIASKDIETQLVSVF